MYLDIHCKASCPDLSKFPGKSKILEHFKAIQQEITYARL